jgi:chorismate mutase
MRISGIEEWTDQKRPVVIAGPCSAESYEQMMETAIALKEKGVNMIRAGVWKPRTRPSSFEGAGDKALEWITTIKKETGLKFAIEVATPVHVQKALKAGIDILWIGARTTVNPIVVQDLADSLKGVNIPVMVKNPVNPEVSLWMGAIERLNQVGVSNLAAVHRGFSSMKASKFRNPPSWHLAIELKSRIPDIPMICDPSHICGNIEMIPLTCQKAMDLDYDGLMIEVHPNPANALSDANQQITPDQFGDLINKLELRSGRSEDVIFLSKLETLREKIDHIDRELLETLAARMKLVEEIGDYKKEKNVKILQLERWKEIITSRPGWGTELDLDEEFIKELYERIHDESIRTQMKVMNQNTLPRS